MTANAPGSLAEEASRLVEAIGVWARGATGGVSTAAMGEAAECQVCPFCQLMALVRRTNPDTFSHLAEASASMMAAVRTIVDKHDHAEARPSGVERIDLDDRDLTTEDVAQ